MEREPLEPNAEGGGATEGGAAGAAFDALRRLEERLDKASDAAERLIAEAAARASGPANAHPPPSGWQVPRTDDASSSTRDIELLVQVLRSLRDLIPPELQQKLAEALRELLLAIRALIDWYLERVEQRRAAPAEVEDIPIL
jgi:hypothetical protein